MRFCIDPADHNLARQHSGDCLFGLKKPYGIHLEQASKMFGLQYAASLALTRPALGLQAKWKETLAARC